MKKLTLVATLLLSFGILSAQPGSVLLKDGGGVPLSSHASITDAFTTIPGPLSQSYIIEITPGYNTSLETFPISLTDKGNAGPANTITIRPAAATNPVIAAGVPGAPVVELDGADYIIFDGRPAGSGSVPSLTIENTDTLTGSHTVAFANGATFNTLRYCIINNNTRTQDGSAVYFGTSPLDPAGNSDNLVEHCKINGGNSNARSQGTTSSPNARNTFYGDEFAGMITAGSWYEHGTVAPNIDSCSFTGNGGTNPTAIRVDSLQDTIRITRNRISGLTNAGTGTGAIRGISINSISGPHLAKIYNNFIALDDPQSTDLVGVALLGPAPMHAEVVHNSIHIFGTLAAGGTSGAIGSAALLRSSSTISGTLQLINNAMVNDRTGGVSGLQHLVLALPSSTGGLVADYNTYNTVTGAYARIGLTVYNTMATYIAALTGDEVNSNDSIIQFASPTDLHLAPSMILNPGLQGTPSASVTRDIDNETRTYPYRGADEAVTCSQPSAGEAKATGNNFCSGSNVEIKLTSYTHNNYYTYQWQSSADGIAYANVTGANKPYMNDTPTTPTYYRAIVSCGLSSQADTSLAEEVIPVSQATLNGINSMPQGGYSYSFAADAPTNVTDYLWDISGSQSSDISPTHVFSGPGIYTIQVMVSNSCYSSSANSFLTVSPFSGIKKDDVENLRLFPNPAESIFRVEGLNGSGTFSIHDISGRQVFNQRVEAGTKSLSFSASELKLNAGVYFASWEEDGAVSKVRIPVVIK